MENAPLPLLQRHCRDLGLSHALVHWLEANHFMMLQDLIERPLHEWFGLPGFTQHGLNELLNFLEERVLLSLVRD